MMTEEELTALHHEAKQALKKYPGVVGVGYGYKEKAGELTEEVGFRVYVAEKKAPGELRPEEILPSEYKGISIDVLKVCSIKKLHCEDTSSHSTLISGINISNMKKDADGSVYVGTLGFFATINNVEAPENVVAVSCHHVLMRNDAVVGDIIYNPQKVDDGNGALIVDEYKPPKIGKIHNAGLEGHHSINDPAGEYYIDCATVKLDTAVSSWCGLYWGIHYKNEVRILNIGGNSKLEGVGQVKGTDFGPNKKYPVYKVGRTTGRTVGKVISLSPSLASEEENLIEIECTEDNCNGEPHFAEGGDSGAALVNDKNELIGIMYAMSTAHPNRAYACHIAPIIDKLGITPITAKNLPKAPAGEALGDTPYEIVDGRFNLATFVRGRLLSTEQGRDVRALIDAHLHEVVHLVNHHRRVTIAWHQSKGPAFLNQLIHNIRDPQHNVPREIEGVTRVELLRAMAAVLSEHGSAPLRAVIEEHYNAVLACAEELDNLHALLERLNEMEQA